MPRSERKKSKTGVYHVVLRGINQQSIFDDDEDCEKMLQIILTVKAICKCKIYAYCLMGNHYHLLLRLGSEGMGQIFKRIGARYVYWYNLKHKRAGHLFQDRYKSEAIENDKHLMGVLRFIHQNPIKAGLCEDLADYPWSSYIEYTGKQRIIDTTYIYKLVGKKNFEEFNKTESEEKFLDHEKTTFRISDAEAREIIEGICNCPSAEDFQKLSSSDLKNFIKDFKESGLSIRQISRLTGISKGIVEHA